MRFFYAAIFAAAISIANPFCGSCCAQFGGSGGGPTPGGGEASSSLPETSIPNDDQVGEEIERRIWATHFWSWYDSGEVSDLAIYFGTVDLNGMNQNPIEESVNVYAELMAISAEDCWNSALDDPLLMANIRHHSLFQELITFAGMSEDDQHLLRIVSSQQDDLLVQARSEFTWSNLVVPVAHVVPSFSLVMLVNDFEDEVEQAIDDSGLPDLGIYHPDGDLPGYDCDDYADAGYHVLERHFGERDVKIEVILILWENGNGLPDFGNNKPTREGHVVVRVTDENGNVVLVDPQTGVTTTGDGKDEQIQILEDGNIRPYHPPGDADVGETRSTGVRIKVFNDPTDYYDNSTDDPGYKRPHSISVEIYERLKELEIEECPYCGGSVDDHLEGYRRALRLEEAKKDK